MAGQTLVCLPSFNEAEARASESHGSFLRNRLIPLCFNEAEARASESLHPRPRPRDSAESFNEAEARASESPVILSIFTRTPVLLQ